MKAKYFKRLRTKLKYYNVWKMVYASCYEDFVWVSPTVVLARSEKEAIQRYNKRNHILEGENWGETVPRYSEYCVQPTDKPFTRFKKYYS